MRTSFLLVALVPAGLIIAAGAMAFKAAFEEFNDLEYVRSITSAGKLSGAFIERYESEATTALEKMPSAPPADGPAGEALRDELGVDFAIWWTGDGDPIVSAPDSLAGIPGLPRPDEWESLAAGKTPYHQSQRALRFFRPGSDGPSYAVGWILSTETAGMLSSARSVVGVNQAIALEWKLWLLGSIVISALVFLTTGIAAFLFARRTARRIARPVGDLAEAADAIAAGDLARRAPVAGEGEVRDLVLSFNRMGEQLETSRDELVRAERVAAWRDVARRIAHEIKNPLTPIRLAVHRLEGRVPADDGSSIECLHSIGEEVENLGRIAGSFSEFAKMPAPDPAPTDFAAITRSVVELFRDAAPQVETSFTGPDTLPIVADRDQLRRAVTNLVKNAQEAVEGAADGSGGNAEAGRDAGPTPSDGAVAGTVRVTLRREDDRAILEVADDGPGIPDEIRETLFRPGVSAKPGGSGLGLAMVHRIAVDHQGALQWGDHGPGARFVFEIPLDPTETDR